MGADALMEECGNAVSNDSGFSAAGSCEDEEGPFVELDGLLLRFVEAFEQVLGDVGFHAVIILLFPKINGGIMIPNPQERDASSTSRGLPDNTMHEHTNTLNAIRRVTLLGAVCNLFLIAFKFAAGIWGHSSVLIADAFHSLSDLITDVAILLGMYFWSRPADQTHPYGHAKIETLVTLFIGISLAIVGVSLFFGAVSSVIDILNNNPPPSPTWFPLVVALAAIVVKEWLYRVTVKVGMATKSSATVANAWHHRSDAMSSIPAAVAIALCLLLGSKYVIFDPIGTVVVSFMIVHVAWKVTQPTFAALLDSGATEAQCQAIAEVIRSFPEVKDLHKLRTRHVGPSGLALDVHIQVDPQMSVTESHFLSHRIELKLLTSGKNIIDVFMHVEPYSEECRNGNIHPPC